MALSDSSEQTLPRELLRSVPRPVRLTALGAGALVFSMSAVAVAAGAGLTLYSVAQRDAERTWMLASGARIAAATVTGVRRAQRDGRHLTITYRYTAAGDEHTGEASLRRRDSIAAVIHEGGSVTVRYLPSNPDQSWLASHEARGLPAWAAGAIPLLLTIGPILIAVVLRRERRLLESGRPALARVTRVTARRSQHGTRWRIEFEWTLLSGASARGRYDKSRRTFEVGSVVPILYDPDEPRRSAPYPFRLVRVDEL